MSGNVHTSVPATPPVVNNQARQSVVFFCDNAKKILFLTILPSSEQETPLPSLGNNVATTTVVALWLLLQCEMWPWGAAESKDRPIQLAPLTSLPSLVHLSAWHSSERKGWDNKSTL